MSQEPQDPRPRAPVALEHMDLRKQARERAARSAARLASRDLAPEGNAQRAAVSRTFVLTALITFSVLAGSALWLTLKGQNGTSPASPVTAPAAALPDAWELAAAFLAADTHEKRLRYIRHPAHAGPLMETFFRTGPGSREQVKKQLPMSDPTLGQALLNRPFSMHTRYGVEMSDGRLRLLCTVEEEGDLKVDFLAYARHCSAAWPDIIEGKASAANVRVFLAQGSNYSGPFADQSTWQAMTATTPDCPETLHFYLRRGTPTARATLKELHPASPRRFVAIQPHGESWRTRQFEITALLSPDWLEPAPRR